MKKSGVLLLLTLALGWAARPQVVLTSLDRGGNLTWTNALSNATYRVEWAGSLAGPWQHFDALTNLTLLSATSNTVTVPVPMFYRVVWVDAPPYAGTYEYRGYDTDDVLAVTGRLYLWGTNSHVVGMRDFQLAPGYTKNVGPQIGTARVDGSGGATAHLDLDLDPVPAADWGQLLADGWLVGDVWVGSWYWTRPPYARGTFRAIRQNSAIPAAPPNPMGVWDYSTYAPVGATVVTGRLAIATAATPVAGTWTFGRVGSTNAVNHAMGDGAFNAGLLSGNSFRIPIPDGREGSFWLEGDMSGGFAAGLWHWQGPTHSETYVFRAVRQGPP